MTLSGGKTFPMPPPSASRVGWRVANTDDVGTALEPTRLTLEERGEDGAPLIPALAALSHGAAAPPQPRALARPGAKRKGLRLRLTCLHGRGSSRRAVAGTPKGAAGPARHVPGRARNEPPRADDVTGQTSDRR